MANGVLGISIDWCQVSKKSFFIRVQCEETLSGSQTLDQLHVLSHALRNFCQWIKDKHGPNWMKANSLLGRLINCGWIECHGVFRHWIYALLDPKRRGRMACPASCQFHFLNSRASATVTMTSSQNRLCVYRWECPDEKQLCTSRCRTIWMHLKTIITPDCDKRPYYGKQIDRFHICKELRCEKLNRNKGKKYEQFATYWQPL